MTTNTEQTVRSVGALKLTLMGVLVFWMPFVFVWFIQQPGYPRAFRWSLIAWAIFWCSCAVLFLIVNIVTGDQPTR